MVDDFERGNLIRRLGVALRSAAYRHRGIDRQRDGGGMRCLPCTQQGRCCAPAGPSAVTLAPHGLCPFEQLAVLGNTGVDAHRHGRGQRGVAQLGLTRPLHPHRAAGHLLGQPCGIPGHVVSAVVPVATGTLDMRDLHLLGRQTESQCQVAPQVEDALAVAPDLQMGGGHLASPLRQSAAQADRRVLHKGPLKLGADALVNDAMGGGRGVGHHRAVQRLCLEPMGQIQRIGHWHAATPKLSLLGTVFDLLGNLAQDLLGLGQHAQQQTVAHHLQHAGNGQQPRHQSLHVVLDHFSGECAWAKHHAVAHGVRHARHDAVVDVFKFSKHFGRHIGAQGDGGGFGWPVSQVERGMRGLRMTRRNRAVPHRRIGQRCIRSLQRWMANTTGQVSRCMKLPACATHVLQRHPQARQALGHGLSAGFAPMRRCTAQCVARVLHRQAARGHRFIGAEQGAGRHHVDLLGGETQFFGHDQTQGVRDALAQIDFA